jgi:uncharacterized membrane protein
MTILIIGALAFALPHILSSMFPAVRDRLMARFGEGAFKGGYSLVTGLGFIAMCVGYFTTRGEGAVFYTPADGARHATMGLATLGFISLAATGGKSHIRLWLQNPMSIGVSLWSVGHLIGVGKVPVVIFYVALLAVALADIIFSMARGKKPEYAPKWRGDIIAVISGVVVAGLLAALFHPYVLGVNVLN